MAGLEGKVAIVTGAASGIGLAIARDFAQHGVRVIVSDVDIEGGRTAADALPGARFLAADMTKGQDIHRLLEPEEVASLVTYLCTDAASAITGSAPTIDCGWTAH